MKLIININNEVMLHKNILKHPIFKMGMCVHTCTHTHTKEYNHRKDICWNADNGHLWIFHRICTVL